MRKYLISTAFISSNILIMYATIKLVKSINDFKNVTDNINFHEIRKESNSIIGSAKLRRT
jgi:hypothetical protein